MRIEGLTIAVVILSDYYCYRHCYNNNDFDVDYCHA